MKKKTIIKTAIFRFLIKEHKKSRDEALKMVQEKRPQVLPNMSDFSFLFQNKLLILFTDFMKQLKQYEEICRKEEEEINNAHKENSKENEEKTDKDSTEIINKSEGTGDGVKEGSVEERLDVPKKENSNSHDSIEEEIGGKAEKLECSGEFEKKNEGEKNLKKVRKIIWLKVRN